MRDLARNWGVDIGGTLHGLDSTNGITGRHVLALFRQLDVDDIAQLLGGVFANAEDTGFLVCGNVDPLVFLGVSFYRI
jgi:hypothetical protein